MIALITAAIMPRKPASKDNVLTMPPRVREEKDSITPSNPKKIAISASTRPATAPVIKLSTAATSAMIEGILNLAAFLSGIGVCGASMRAHYCKPADAAKHDLKHRNGLTAAAGRSSFQSCFL